MNGFDCGAFMCIIMERLSRRAPLVGERNRGEFRKEIGDAIMAGHLQLDPRNELLALRARGQQMTASTVANASLQIELNKQLEAVKKERLDLAIESTRYSLY